MSVAYYNQRCYQMMLVVKIYKENLKNNSKMEHCCK